MKRLLLLLGSIGMIFTACEDSGGNTSIPQIGLSQQIVEVEFIPYNYTVTVTSPYSWKAESDNEWIIVESETGIAGVEQLSFKVERNEGEKVRKGTIVIKNDNCNLYAELYVIQAIAPYQIGDLVEKNGAKGVVFAVSDDAKVKMVSVTESTSIKWGEYGVTIGADDISNGANNTTAIQSIIDWEIKCPAFKWCAEYGEKWYLPALDELREICYYRDVINETLSVNGYATLSGFYYYWSSTEVDGGKAFVVNFQSSSFEGYGKSGTNNVRAVLVF